MADSKLVTIRHRRRLFGAAALLLVLLAGLAYAANSPWVRGYGLYHGWLPLKGRIAGHSMDLPEVALRCANCHEPANRAGLAARQITDLDAAHLTVQQPRRGGPASAYDVTSFCALIANGIDPAYVMVDRTMPNFDMSEADCAALWSYVSQR